MNNRVLLGLVAAGVLIWLYRRQQRAQQATAEVQLTAAVQSAQTLHNTPWF